MHISSANNFNAAIQQLMQRQNDLSTSQEQLTTGLRVNKASDDPAAAARAERALASEARDTATQRAVDASNNTMTLSESALGSANDLLQSIREAMVQAGNASLTDADRKSLAAQITQLRGQLLNVANSTDGNGAYLFGGQGSNSAPFIDAAGGVQYNGESGQNIAATNESLPLSVDGQASWMQAPTGNGVFVTSAVTSTGSAWVDAGSVTSAAALTGSTYQVQFSVAGGNTTYSVFKDGVATAQANVAFTPGQAVQIDGMTATISGQPANGDAFQFAPSTPTSTVFNVLDKTIADLNTSSRTDGQIAQANSSNLQALDSVMNQLQTARSQAGAVLNRIDGVTSRLSALKLASQTEVSNATDLDMTQALSTFQNQQTGYSAALKAYSMVQGLTMFNYLTSS
jgi:flagellar hook-associated protein 3 FlgL